MTNQISEKRFSWQELDILRGLAALFMVVNHGGYEILNPDLANHGISGTIIFLGSFAPVLFFFATGVGYGLQFNQKIKSNYWSDVIYKVILLIIADQFFFWKKRELFGLDFLGFIAFSTLVMAGIRVSKKSLFYAIFGFVIVSTLRYFIGPYLEHSGVQADDIVTWIIGTKSLSNVSYPLSPWLAYPFVGYIFGVGIIKYQEELKSKRFTIIIKLLLLSILPAIASLILWYKGASFFRWGTVSFGFYLVSFVVLFSIMALSLLMKANPSVTIWQDMLSLRGISSLAVVPIHYSLISFATFIGIKNLGFMIFAFVISLIVALSFFLGHQVNYWSYWLSQSQNPKAWRLIIFILLFLAAILTIFYNQNSFWPATISSSLGQILLCFLLVLRR